MGEQLIRSVECQKNQHKTKTYEVGCEVRWWRCTGEQPLCRRILFKIVERRHCEDSTVTFIEINYNYNPHVCTIDCVLHWGQVEQERILQRLTDLIQYFFEHHDHASDTGMFIVIEL